MNPEHERFMKGVGLYEEANKKRDEQKFDFAFELYESAQGLLGGKLDVPLFYDMALAADFKGDFDLTCSYFEKCKESLESIKNQNPFDTRIPNLQPLIDGLFQQIEVRKLADNQATNYAQLVRKRKWTADKFPLRVWIQPQQNNIQTGFDSALSDLIFNTFKQWENRCPWLRIFKANAGDEAISHIVVKKAGEQNLQEGSGGQTNFIPPDNDEISRSEIWLYSPSTKLSALNADQKRIFTSLVLHEAGHALGIDGHSPYGDDLMYFKSPLLALSPRDVETMKTIYEQ